MTYVWMFPLILLILVQDPLLLETGSLLSLRPRPAHRQATLYCVISCSMFLLGVWLGSQMMQLVISTFHWSALGLDVLLIMLFFQLLNKSDRIKRDTWHLKAFDTQAFVLVYLVLCNLITGMCTGFIVGFTHWAWVISLLSTGIVLLAPGWQRVLTCDLVRVTLLIVLPVVGLTATAYSYYI